MSISPCVHMSIVVRIEPVAIKLLKSTTSRMAFFIDFRQILSCSSTNELEPLWITCVKWDLGIFQAGKRQWHHYHLKILNEIKKLATKCWFSFTINRNVNEIQWTKIKFEPWQCRGFKGANRDWFRLHMTWCAKLCAAHKRELCYGSTY